MQFGPISGVLCAGNIVLDLLVRPVDRLVWNTTTWVEEVEQYLGGNGANTSFALARLGIRVRLIGYTGRDGFGDFAVAELEQAGVDIAGIERIAEPTALTVGLVNSSADRLFLHRGGASKLAFPEPLDFSPFAPDPPGGAAYSHFHMANLFGLPLLRRHAGETLRRAKAAGFTTSLDTGWDSKERWMADLAPCLPHVDLLFVNQNESENLTGQTSPELAASALLARGAGIVVTKLGAQGCLVSTPEDAFHMPAFQVAPVDTTGAGDCFAGGFLAALHHSPDLNAAARIANAAGALSTSHLGAVTGLLSWEETLDWTRRHPAYGSRV